MASLNDDSRINKALEDDQPRLDAAPQENQLFEAIDRDDVEWLERILTGNPSGCDITDKYGCTLLHRAAGRGRMECLRYIVEKDCNSISKKDKRGCHPLHHAACNGQVEAVQLLLDSNADINIKNEEEEIPLFTACLSGSFETVGILLDQHYKESPSQLPPTDATDNTLLHMCMIGNHLMVKELLKKMLSLGYTTEQLQQLVESQNTAKQTILDMAKERCQLRTIRQHLSQLQLSIMNVAVKDEDQNEDVFTSQQAERHHKDPNTLLLVDGHMDRNDSVDSRVTPSTDGVNVLCEIVKKSIVKKQILHKDHKVELHVLTVNELPPGEQDRSLALNRSKDTAQQLELLCGIHGNVLNKLPPDCYLISSIVMVKLAANRPLMMSITIPHALATNKTATSKASKKHQASEVQLYVFGQAGVIGVLESENYKLDLKSCTVTMVIDKQQTFALTVTGKFTTHARLFPTVTTNKPLAINCIYFVLVEPNDDYISVRVYCTINLPIAWKLLSDISKRPRAKGEFVLSHEHIDISYHCVRNIVGWSVSNSSHKADASSILPSSQSEHFLYPSVWEFRVSPKQNASHVSERVTCKLLITAGRTELAQQHFDHDRPRSYYSRQSTPNSTADPLLSGRHEQLELVTPVPVIPVQCDTLNMDSMEHHTLVGSVYPEASLTSTMQKTNVAKLTSNQPTILTKLDLSGHNVTDQWTDMINKKPTCSTLKEINISNDKLKTTIAIKNLTALEISSLKVLRLNNNDIDDEAAGGIAALISNNHLLEDLNISCNNFSASGLIPIVQALSMAKNIKLLDISSNFRDYSSTDAVNHLSTTLAECSTLQELNVSNNLLTFSNVLKIAEALRNHPNLEIFNISENITSYFLECEFLIDIILSTNHLLTNINVCSRNIRPRFNDECLIFPLNYTKDSNRFILQNLYFSQHSLGNTYAQTANSSGKSIGFNEAKEKYPIYGEKIVSYCVDHNGGTFYNEDHDFAIVIPPGAVSQGDCVQVQATASRFSHCKLPDEYYPISSYFWLSACYTFKIPVYLIMSHYAKIRNLEDIDSLCVLHACDHDDMTSEELVMKKVPSGVYYDYKIGYCVFTTDHFCSICLAKENKFIPGKFLAFLYTKDSDKEYFAEVCFCPAICDCKEVIRKQYEGTQWKSEYPTNVLFNFTEEEKLLIPKQFFSKIKGWSVRQLGQPEIPFDDFKYWQIPGDVEGLMELEKNRAYPPRFQIYCSRNKQNVTVDLDCQFEVVTTNKKNNTSCIGIFLLIKNATSGKSFNEVERNISLSNTSELIDHHDREYCFQPQWIVLSSIRWEFGTKWKHVGLILEINHNVLDHIELNFQQIQEKSFNMMAEWMRRDPNPCYCKLIFAMNEEGLLSGIEVLKSKIKLVHQKTNTQSLAIQAAMQSNVQQLEATMADPPEYKIFSSEPEMGDLNKIVIPKINANWEEVAYALCFKIHTVESIASKHNDNPKKCCRELLKNWLSTSNGVGPKSWSTLLSKLKDVEELATATEEIIKELVKMYPEV